MRDLTDLFGGLPEPCSRDIAFLEIFEEASKDLLLLGAAAPFAFLFQGDKHIDDLPRSGQILDARGRPFSFLAPNSTLAVLPSMSKRFRKSRSSPAKAPSFPISAMKRLPRNHS